MKNIQTKTRIAVAIGTMLIACAGQVRADDDPELRPFTKPDSSVDVGAGYVSDNARAFNPYIGFNDRGPVGLLGVDLVTRDDATGTWFTLKGRDLGTETRELRLEHNRQGSWGYFIDLGRTPYYDPLVINTRVRIDSPGAQTVGGLAQSRPLEVGTRRDTIKLGAAKTLIGGFDVEVNFRNEEKTGEQIFGQGFFGPFNYLNNPVNTTTRQLDVVLNYVSERLQLTGGYYGTEFFNHVPALAVTGGIADLSPIALPPGNQSHQFNFSGGYDLTPTTRGTFKAAWTHQTQNETFASPSVSGRTDLGGEVDTTLLQAAITARPLPRLSLLANVRYEDRNDKTPVALYLTTGVTGASTTDGFNTPNSLRATSAKVEATYELPASIRLTGGVDYDKRERSNSRVHDVSFRADTDETTVRAELRRSMFDTLTGSISYAHADRGGSNYDLNVLNDGTIGANQVNPLNIADRKRDKVRATVNWQPLDALSIGVYADYAKDEYSGRLLGPRDGTAGTYALDASYALTDKWQLTGWLSRNDVKANQSSCSFGTPAGVCVSAVASPLWSARLRNQGDAVGATLRGKMAGGIEVGADASYSRDKSEYNLATTTAGATLIAPPDIWFRVTRVNLFGKYALGKGSDLKLNYAYQRWTTDDWTWNTWTYTDGTKVLKSPEQKVHFIGVTYSQHWQ